MSGIYIHGERIPDTLTAFWIYPNGYVKVFGKNGDEIRERKAVPVPEHDGRLIDELDIDFIMFEKKMADEFDGVFITTLEEVNATPTIIEAEEEQT